MSRNSPSQHPSLPDSDLWLSRGNALCIGNWLCGFTSSPLGRKSAKQKYPHDLLAFLPMSWSLHQPTNKVPGTYRVNPQDRAMQLITTHPWHVHIRNSATVKTCRSSIIQTMHQSVCEKRLYCIEFERGAAQCAGNRHHLGLRGTG